MPGRFPKRRARHGAGRGLAAIACLTAAALAVHHAIRNGPAVQRGTGEVLRAAAIGAAILAAVAVLVVITWAALRRGHRARRWEDEAPGLPEADLTVSAEYAVVAVPERLPAPEQLPAPERLPGRPLFIRGGASRSGAAAADHPGARSTSFAPSALAPRSPRLPP